MPIDAVAPPSRHWLGEPTDVPSHGSFAAVLDGSCGHAGCCGVFALIELTDDTVAWSHFWSRGGPSALRRATFSFDRRPYEAAIVAVRDLPMVPYDVHDEW